MVNIKLHFLYKQWYRIRKVSVVKASKYKISFTILVCPSRTFLLSLLRIILMLSPLELNIIGALARSVFLWTEICDIEIVHRNGDGNSVLKMI